MKGRLWFVFLVCKDRGLIVLLSFDSLFGYLICFVEGDRLDFEVRFFLILVFYFILMKILIFEILFICLKMFVLNMYMYDSLFFVFIKWYVYLMGENMVFEV